MYYRVQEADHWMVSCTLRRQGEWIGGGEVVKRYLPQWSRGDGEWQTYRDLGFQRDGFATVGAAEAFLERKNPQYRERFKGVSPLAVKPETLWAPEELEVNEMFPGLHLQRNIL